MQKDRHQLERERERRKASPKKKRQLHGDMERKRERDWPRQEIKKNPLRCMSGLVNEYVRESACYPSILHVDHK